MKFAITKTACPLLNTPEFSSVFTHPLPLDFRGLLAPVEMVALPGTPLVLVEQKTVHIWQVSLEGYPAGPLFADLRFLRVLEHPADFPKKQLPREEELLMRLDKFEGSSYIWGGNWRQGIPQLLEWYPPACALDCTEEKRWALEGVDCSGLLYEATEGHTPRNTSQLVHFGEAVPIKGLSAGQIAERLKPLDLIVWAGHVIIVRDEQTAMESSCAQGGVVTSRLDTRLAEVLAERGDSFTVRRWS